MTKPIRAYLVVCAATVLLQSVNAVGQQNSDTPTTSAQSAQHDGQRDFDFELGTWKIHLKRLQLL